MADPPVCVLGIGAMGAAFARRFRSQNVDVSIWNRSLASSEIIQAEDASACCKTAPSAAASVSISADSSLVIIAVTNSAAVLDILEQEGMSEALEGRTLLNVTSANPDEARQIAANPAVISNNVNFIDCAYVGSPTAARYGKGQLFLSSDSRDAIGHAQELLSLLGSITFCGDIGASRALDYGIVDLLFVNLLSFMSNSEILEREGVDMNLFFQEAAKTLEHLPSALERCSKRMESRSEDAYAANVTCSLQTARNYWAGRLPYNHANNIPSHLTNLFVSCLDEASGGHGGAHSGADISRLQEVVRYGDDCDSPGVHDAKNRCGNQAVLERHKHGYSDNAYAQDAVSSELMHRMQQLEEENKALVKQLRDLHRS